MRRLVGALFVAGAIVLGAPVSATTAAAPSQHVIKQDADAGQVTDFSARRHYRRHYHYGYRPHYQPCYYARPCYYRPYPYDAPAPFSFGFGFGPFVC
jgi:hypothetical protein